VLGCSFLSTESSREALGLAEKVRRLLQFSKPVGVSKNVGAVNIWRDTTQVGAEIHTGFHVVSITLV
jgi:hypothetical protein